MFPYYRRLSKQDVAFEKEREKRKTIFFLTRRTKGTDRFIKRERRRHRSKEVIHVT
jgi:hypothetical protein